MAKLYYFIRGDDRMGKMTVFNIAEIFLSWEAMTHKKLQKLCYYAQAWHLALLKVPLFDGRFEAWVHGPVEPSLYSNYKAHGWGDIPTVHIDLTKFSPDQIEFLEAVFRTYGKFSGDQLEALTHSEQPWIEARQGLEEWEPSHNTINENIMKVYYSKVYEQAQND